MLETIYDQLRFVASIAFGFPFNLHSLDRLVESLLATQHEFGSLGAEAGEMLGGPMLDEETRRDVQLRRFRTQARRAAGETPYYGPLFQHLGLDPAQLTYEDMSRIPITPKEALREDPDAFIRRTAQPVFRTATTGTTGRPTSICFSAEEMAVYSTLTAAGLLLQGRISPEDIVQISTSSRATLGNTCFAGACARAGAMVYQVGLVEPEYTLALLAEKRRVAGKKLQTSIMSTYPSYLGELTETGLRLGYKPGDFGLERIAVGGEIVTAGLKARCQTLFGPVHFDEGFGMTEPWPFGGTLCSEGHLHFEISHGLLEVLRLEDGTPTGPGEAGTLVLTPFPPFRQTTILLRYDTQDVVRPLAGPFTCSLRHQPATSDLLGKLCLSVRHDGGWAFPRDILEALEALEMVPLPARCGFWAVPDGVAVEVLVRENTAETYRQIKRSLEEREIPLQELILVENRSHLRQPLLLRGDLREILFKSPQQSQTDRNLPIRSSSERNLNLDLSTISALKFNVGRVSL